MIDDLVKDVLETGEVYKKLIGGFAPATQKILDNSDKIKALSNLVKTADVQKGFKALRDAGKLKNTFEALIIKHNNLFRKDIVDAAQWRIDNANNIK
ncbi:hypothetical protein AGMMS49587_11900 [Spirochaetia bacterium]|nr:hypothetical protein AGMMS49587_11900 [Spirochaetia bacterium]